MIVILVFILIVSILFGQASVANDLHLQLSLVFIVWIFNVLFACFKIKKRFIFFSFHMTFFLFLLGEIFAANLEGYKQDFSSVINNFSIPIKSHIYFSLFLSLVGLLLGGKIFDSSKKTKLSFDWSSNGIVELRQLSRKMLLFLYVFKFILEIEKVFYVAATSYVDLYLSFNSNFPIIFVRLADIYSISFLLFLATMPSYKEAKLPILLYFILGLFPLIYGQRTNFGLIVLFVLIYLILRKSLSLNGDGNLWFNKRRLLVVVISIPFVLIGFLAISYIRQGESFHNTGILHSLVSILGQQGGSVGIIGYEKVYGSQMPQTFPFSLGFIVDFFKNSFLIRPLGLFDYYAPQTEGLAMHGLSFGSTLSYLVMPQYYLSGGGLGSCYIAEAYHDYGYIGLFLVNLFYGFIFNVFNRNLSSVWIVFSSLLIVENILIIPRGNSLDFLRCFFSYTLLFYIYFMYKYKQRKENNSKLRCNKNNTIYGN